MTMNNNKNQGNTGFRIRMFFKRLNTTGSYRRVLYICRLLMIRPLTTGLGKSSVHKAEVFEDKQKSPLTNGKNR